ncbi:MAG: hypothetical protein L6Q97_22040, partial [Thermoanaerobaculia bacterium]|nr:hypothetical protein [Thermoanaerobaculia bacterium]
RFSKLGKSGFQQRTGKICSSSLFLHKINDMLTPQKSLSAMTLLRGISSKLYFDKDIKMPVSLSFLLVFSAAMTNCQTRQNGQSPTIAQNTHLIPEAGILVAFPTEPTFSTPPATETAPHFDNARHYDCIQQYNDSSTYFRHIGVYWSDKKADNTAMLENGVSMNEKMLKGAGMKILLKENFNFKGIPARKIKAYFPGNKQQDLSAFYVSMIFFVREGYFIEMTIMNASKQDDKWKNDDFFESVSFADATPLATNLTGSEDQQSCKNKLPCNFNEHQLSVCFSNAPLVREKKEGSFRVKKYHSVPPQVEPTIFYALEIYERDESLETLPDSVYNQLLLPINQIVSPSDIKEKIISRNNISYKGRTAFEAKIKTEVPPNEDGIKEVIIHSITFVHHGKVIHLFVYLLPGFKAYPQAQCFFDSADFW